MSRQTTSIAAVLAAASLMSGSVEAQNYYRSVPIGQQAIGLGGAYTGLADDPSAAYYNPAGLMRRDVNQLSGGLSLVAVGRVEVEDGFLTPSSSQTFSERTLQTLPTFLGGRLGLGKPRHGRTHRLAIAYSSLEPRFEDDLFDTSSQGMNAIGAARVESAYRMSLYGISLAGATSKKLMLGGTLYLAVQRFFHSEDLTVAASRTGVGGSFVNPSARLADTRISARTFHFLPRLGLLYQFNPKWSLGVVVQTPGIPFVEKGSTQVERTSIEPPNSGEPTVLFFQDSSGLDANAPIPWEVRVGTAFSPNQRLVITLDGSLHGRVADQERVDFEAAVQDVGVFYSNSTARRLIGNVAVGAEQRFGNFSVQGGFFTNLSAALTVPQVSARYTEPRIDLYGVSASAQYDTDRYNFSTGLTFSWGRGDALGAFVDPGTGTITYQAQPARRRTFVVHVAGIFRAAAKATRDVLDDPSGE